MKLTPMIMMAVALAVLPAAAAQADDTQDCNGSVRQVAGICGVVRSCDAEQLIADIQANEDPSYVLFSPHYGTGATFGGDYGSKNILFEGRISHQFHVFDLSCLSRLTNHAVEGFLTFNPKIVLRMYRGTSVPVKTPSYMPDLTWYAWHPSWIDGDRRWFLSVRVGHHSNGQSGPFMKAGRVNTADGNFSTNYWRIAINHMRHQAKFDWSGEFAFTSHFGSPQGFFSREPGLEGQYEKQKFTFGIKAARSFGHESDTRTASLSSSLSVDYISRGKDFVIKPTLPASAADKWNVTAELRAKPYFFDEVHFFAKYDYGYDYYNIHFQERINRLMLGIAGVIGGR